MDVPKKYKIHDEEEELMQKWQDEGLYEFEDDDKPNFVIDTPPPTVSGKMHVGHACSYSHGDMIARFKRLSGYNVYYPFGTDDNGLPTERLVEKRKNVNMHDMTREEFRQVCRDFLKNERPGFVKAWQRIGSSCDFNNVYSTISKKSIKTSQKSFIDLFKKGYLDRRDSPVAWCTTLQTSAAQAEFKSVEMSTFMNKIVFKNTKKELVIGTTRPELLPACVALAAHPDDERYNDLEGSRAKAPLFDFDVPIILDKDVEKDKGTGLMMVCTFGDKEDIEKWKRHNLPLKMIISKDGKINSSVPRYEGLTIREARLQIVKDLEEEGLLVSKKRIKHHVNVHDRSDTPIEFIKTSQWFVKVLNKKEELINAGNKVDWHPSFMKKRYQHWVEGLNWDWCISRQRSFGVPFPVWYSKKTGEIIVASEDELPVDPQTDMPKNLPKGHSKEDVVAEMDVMDTWATSALTPQIILDWAEDEEFHDENLPTGMRHMAHDIIRTWAFYTITKSQYHFDKIPWKNIMVSGFVQDPKGNKMSKSKGNVVDPKKVVDEYGADALRYWASTSKLGEDFPFKEKDLKTGKKTVLKIWNASKFTFMNLDKKTVKKYKETHDLTDLSIIDKWMITKVMKANKEAKKQFENYEYSKARMAIDDVFWKSFCDNYLELVKHRVYGDDIGVESNYAAQRTLYQSLLDILRMYSPIMPFITDKVYRAFYEEFEDAKSIHVSSWPTLHEDLLDEKSEAIGDLLVDIVGKVRKYKSSNGMSLREELETITIHGSEPQIHYLRQVEDDLMAVGKIKDVQYEVGKEDTLRIHIKA